MTNATLLPTQQFTAVYKTDYHPKMRYSAVPYQFPYSSPGPCGIQRLAHDSSNSAHQSVRSAEGLPWDLRGSYYEPWAKMHTATGSPLNNNCGNCVPRNKNNKPYNGARISYTAPTHKLSFSTSVETTTLLPNHALKTRKQPTK
jgi:hypothetical protein